MASLQCLHPDLANGSLHGIGTGCTYNNPLTNPDGHDMVVHGSVGPIVIACVFLPPTFLGLLYLRWKYGSGTSRTHFKPQDTREQAAWMTWTELFGRRQPSYGPKGKDVANIEDYELLNGSIVGKKKPVHIAQIPPQQLAIPEDKMFIDPRPAPHAPRPQTNMHFNDDRYSRALRASKIPPLPKFALERTLSDDGSFQVSQS